MLHCVRDRSAHSFTSASLIGRLGSSAFWLSPTGSVDVTCGLVLLSGIGAKGPSIMGSEDKVERSLGRPCRDFSAGPSGHANSPYPSSRKGHLHHLVELEYLLRRVICQGCHAAAVASRVQRNWLPSTQIRCMITASRRARATIAFFMPQRLATCIAQALSQDHLFARSMLWAAS